MKLTIDTQARDRELAGLARKILCSDDVYASTREIIEGEQPDSRPNGWRGHPQHLILDGHVRLTVRETEILRELWA